MLKIQELSHSWALVRFLNGPHPFLNTPTPTPFWTPHPDLSDQTESRRHKNIMITLIASFVWFYSNNSENISLAWCQQKYLEIPDMNKQNMSNCADLSSASLSASCYFQTQW